MSNSLKKLGDIVGGIICTDKKDIIKSGYDSIRKSISTKKIFDIFRILKFLEEKGKVKEDYLDRNQDSLISLTKALESDDLSKDKVLAVQKIFIKGAIEDESSNKIALYIDPISGLSLGEIIALSGAYEVIQNKKVPTVDDVYIHNTIAAIMNERSSLTSVHEVANNCEKLMIKGLIIDFNILHALQNNRAVTDWKIRLGNVSDPKERSQNFILTKFGRDLCEYIVHDLDEVEDE